MGSVTSIFENFETQAESACQSVLSNPLFQGEFNVLGLSQGGLIARYIVEQCPTKVPVRNMVTLGGPHKGVAAIPNCGYAGIMCEMIDFVADNLVYFDKV
jgi:palmitoyl-protein thioesterase